MSLRAQKPGQVKAIAKMCGQYIAHVAIALLYFFMAAVLCIACGLILAQNPELILVLDS